MIRVKELEKMFNDLAPEALKEDFDNVGLMTGDEDAEINKILVSLDCTMEAIDEAIEKECDMIFTHHPLIFKRPKNITSKTIHGKKILTLIKNNIAVYSAHTNLDSVFGGLGDLLTRMIFFKDGKIIDENKIYKSSGIGRFIILEEDIKMEKLLLKLKENLNLEGLRYSGNIHDEVKRIAIINGSGEDFFDDIVKLDAQVIITGDTTYHKVVDFLEEGIYVIDIGHFKSEFEPLKAFAKELYKILKEKVEIEISESSKDPYGFY